MTDDDVEVRRPLGVNRFEILVDGEPVGYSSFRESGDTRVFLHTEIDSAFEGRGLGGRLIQAALDQTRADGMRIEPQCRFVRSFIEQHEDYADLVA